MTFPASDRRGFAPPAPTVVDEEFGSAAMVDSRRRKGKKTASTPPASARRRPPSANRGSLRLGLVLGALVLINLYVFLWRDRTSLPDVMQQARTGGPVMPPHADPGVPVPDPGQPDNDDPAAPVPPPPDDAPELAAGVTEGKVEKGDSLGRILKRAGLGASEADEVIRALHDILDFRAIRAGQAYRLERDPEGRVLSFELAVSRLVTVRAARSADGAMAGTKSEAATRIEVDEVGGRIDSSLYASVKAAGEDTALVAFFVDVFAYDLDFYNDTHEGDTFKVLIEKEYKDQEFLRYRRILGAEYAGKAGTFRAFWWQAPGAKNGRYYDEQGRSVEKSLLKTPLKFARVSSGFNAHRMHPILHVEKGHFGTDYAAPVGTPVWAAADGVISSRGPAGGAGNMVVLRHDNGLTTLYMHLSRFAPGQQVGQRVAGKTVIGYVGTTGLSTGPHLHFGVKKDGVYVDPLKLAPTRAAGVSKKDMDGFRAATAPIIGKLGRIQMPPAAPVAANGAPAAPIN
jgi:murein DD-endopeptidase MepM/ murein hydrolase activator NlpD